MIVLSEKRFRATGAVARHQPRTGGIHLRRGSGGSLLTWFYLGAARILPQSTAAGSEGGKLARQRSYHVRTTPLPAMVTIPASVHPSGNVSNTTHPASVDHSSCMYVKGAMAETDAR